MARGEVGVEVYFPDRSAGNAGLIVKVDRPGIGADAFTGYEISLDPSGSFVRLGRHRRNWEPIRDVPCDVPLRRWIPLVVRMEETSVEVSVNGTTMIRYEDKEHPLQAGLVGLRTWQREAMFRNLWIKVGNRKKLLRFEVAGSQWAAGSVSGMWRPR